MPRTQTHATPALTDLHHEIRKRQRALLRQITTCDEQMAKLFEKRNRLRREVTNIAEDVALEWACQGQNHTDPVLTAAAIDDLDLDEADDLIDADDDEIEGAA